MDDFTNKNYETYDYLSRYTGVPYYFDTKNKREIYGIGYNMKKVTDWVAHTVKQGDTLDSLALNYYNNPTFWWVIAYFNDIQDPFINLTSRFEIIKIPSISGIEFGDLR